MDTFEKLRIALRYFLLGKDYTLAMDALEFAGSYHTGKRKDGITPEYQHQVEIAMYLVTILPSLAHPEETIISALLHDVSEDYDVPNSSIHQRYGTRVAHAVDALNKNGKTTEYYFANLATDEIASVVKGADRMHNLQSMLGVFTREKQLKYIAEVEQLFLPMLKKARRAFPKQVNAYENIKLILTSQVELLKAINNAPEAVTYG